MVLEIFQRCLRLEETFQGFPPPILSKIHLGKTRQDGTVLNTLLLLLALSQDIQSFEKVLLRIGEIIHLQLHRCHANQCPCVALTPLVQHKSESRSRMPQGHVQVPQTSIAPTQECTQYESILLWDTWRKFPLLHQWCECIDGGPVIPLATCLQCS